MSSSSQVAESWISSFCSLLGHEYFAEVSEDFIEDDFNLTGLQSLVPMYKEALEMILDVEPEEDDDEEEEEEEEDDEDDMLGGGTNNNEGGGLDRPSGYRRAGEIRRHLRMASDLSVIETSAELLYGLIHQRYITSRPGIQQMAEKYELQHFGVCPRVNCGGCKVLPVGLVDTPGQETVKLFCPSCLDAYTPPNSRFQSVDGAFFGTTFGCLFFMTFPDLDVAAGITRPVGPHDTAAAAAVANEKSPTGTQTGAAVLSGTSQQSNHQDASNPLPILPTQPTTINGVLPHNLAPGLGVPRIYEPRIYGFRVSERSRSGPRMRWLRMRPNDLNELDEAKRWDEEEAEDLQDQKKNGDQIAAAGEAGMGSDGGGGGGGEDEEVTSLEEEGVTDGVLANDGGIAAAARQAGGAEDQLMPDAGNGAAAGARRKKKATSRKKGPTVATGGMVSGANGSVPESPMDTNGVRDVG